MIKLAIFDWGNTLMIDLPGYTGPMAFWEKVEKIEGVEEILIELKRKNIHIAVASNAKDSNSQLMKQAFERVDLDHYIDSFYTSFELENRKPELDFFKKIMEEHSALPSETIIIGDTLDKDIFPAIQLKTNFILFDWQQKYSSFIKNRVTTLFEFLLILEKILNKN